MISQARKQSVGRQNERAGNSHDGRYRIAVILSLLMIWGLLLVRLHDIPPGFQHDQMFNSLDVLDVLQGKHAIYFPANFGREAIGIYSAAVAFGLTAATTSGACASPRRCGALLASPSPSRWGGVICRAGRRCSAAWRWRRPSGSCSPLAWGWSQWRFGPWRRRCSISFVEARRDRSGAPTRWRA